MAMHTRPSVKLATLGLGRSSIDLSLVVISLAATAIAVLLNAPAFVRVPLASALVFFVPGYALSVALFPAGEAAPSKQLGGSITRDGIAMLDRIVISVGASVSIVVLAGLVIDMLPTVLSAESVLGVLVAVTAVAVFAGVHRRRSTPPAHRYVPFEPSATDGDRGPTSSRTLTVVRLALAASLIFAGAALIHSAGATDGQQGVTELYFLTEGEDGQLEGADYPVNLTVDEERPLAVAVGNHEGETVEYTLVGQRQRVQRTNGSLSILERQEVLRERVTVDAGESRTVNATTSAPETGEYRVVYLLYEGVPPEEPRRANADENVYLWIDVDDAASTAVP